GQRAVVRGAEGTALEEDRARVLMLNAVPFLADVIEKSIFGERQAAEELRLRADDRARGLDVLLRLEPPVIAIEHVKPRPRFVEGMPRHGRGGDDRRVDEIVVIAGNVIRVILSGAKDPRRKDAARAAGRGSFAVS